MDPNDRGVRKFRIALTAMGLVFAGYVLCQPMPSLGALYPGYCMALLGAAGIFSGTNLFEKRAAKAKPDEPNLTAPPSPGE